MGTAQLAASSSFHSDAIIEFTGPPAEHPTDAEHDLEILRAIPNRFEVIDAKSANWVTRKVQEARAHANRVKLWADREVARAAREERVILYLFGRQLESWAKSEVAKFNGRRKSLPLPDGTLSFRNTGPKVVVDDERAVIEWARQNLPEAIATVERLMKSVLNECVEKSGIIPDEGAHIEPASEKFFIR